MMYLWFVLACAAGYGVYFCWEQFKLAGIASDSGLLVTGLIGSGARIMWAVFGISCAVFCFNFLAHSIAAGRAQSEAEKAAAQQAQVDAVKEEKKESPQPEPQPEAPKSKYLSGSSSLYDFYRDVRVAGVTFKNGRRSRQTILRQIYWRDEPYKRAPKVTLQLGEYEGEPAISVWTNEEQIGYLPADLAKELGPRFDDIDDPYDFEVYGGGKTDAGEQINFGASLSLRVKR